MSRSYTVVCSLRQIIIKTPIHRRENIQRATHSRYFYQFSSTSSDNSSISSAYISRKNCILGRNPQISRGWFETAECLVSQFWFSVFTYIVGGAEHIDDMPNIVVVNCYVPNYTYGRSSQSKYKFRAKLKSGNSISPFKKKPAREALSIKY